MHPRWPMGPPPQAGVYGAGIYVSLNHSLLLNERLSSPLFHTLEDAASQRDSAAAKTGCTQAYSACEEVTFARTYASPGCKV